MFGQAASKLLNSSSYTATGKLYSIVAARSVWNLKPARTQIRLWPLQPARGAKGMLYFVSQYIIILDTLSQIC